jgi:hypothetical protein
MIKYDFIPRSRVGDSGHESVGKVVTVRSSYVPRVGEEIVMTLDDKSELDFRGERTYTVKSVSSKVEVRRGLMNLLYGKSSKILIIGECKSKR